MNQRNPHLTFACELRSDALQALFDHPTVMDTLVALRAGVSMGLLDLSAERAAVVQRLNRAGIPLTAWLLLPEEQGYWFNVDNAAQAAARYAEFRAWTLRHDLQWAGVGIDIEPAMADMRMLMTGDFGALLPRLLGRLADRQRIQRARQAYLALISRMRSDGYAVESYQFPFIADERQAGSTLLQRLFGVLDIATDREVLMLYSSILPDFGPGIIGSYGPDAQGIGVGSTGGGVELEGGAPLTALTWEQFARDLRLAQRWSDPIFIFSLEGCAQQGFLARLGEFDWAQPVELPPAQVRQVDAVRRTLRGLLWASAHPQLVLAGLLGVLWVLSRLFRRRSRR